MCWILAGAVMYNMYIGSVTMFKKSCARPWSMSDRFRRVAMEA